MTARTPSYLKTHFENGDIPVQTDYEDVFDSFLPMANGVSAEQTVNPPVKFAADLTIVSASATYIRATNLSVTTKVTAGAMEILGAASVSRMWVDVDFYSPIVFAQSVSATTVSALATYSELVSTSALRTNTASANTSYIASNTFIGAVDVSAVGSTQAQATVLSAPVSFVIYADKGDYGVKLGTSQRGLVQNVINASTTAIRIYPAVSARFLVTAFNASLSIPADRVATIFHKGDDRYGIQIG